MAEARKKAAKTAAESFTKASETMRDPMSYFPQPDFSRMEMAVPYREIAEKGLAQAKQSYDRMKVVAEEATGVLETTYATAARGASEYGIKLMDALRANMNANFDFAREMLTVRSPSEMIELSTSHARKQFEALSAQGRELASLAQKVSNDTAEPMKSGMNKALSAVA